MKLKDLYGGLTNKSKLMITLLADPDVTFECLKRMQVKELVEQLSSLDIDEKLKLYSFEELLYGKEDGEKAFTNPSGRSYSSTDIEKILCRAHERNGFVYEGRIAFSNKIHSRKKGRV